MTTEEAVRTFTIQKLLVGLADDESSDFAARAAVDLAQRFDAALDMVHVVPVPGLLGVRFSSSQVESMRASLIEAAATRIRDRLEKLDLPADVIAKVRSVAGRPGPTLLEEIDRVGADVVVLGGSGHRRQLDFGGAARAAYAKSHVAVWLQPGPVRPLKTLLVPIDLSAHSLHALERAIALAKTLDARIEVIHAFDPIEFTPYGAPDGPVLGPTYAIDAVRDGARTAFEERMAETEWGGVEHRAHFIEGDPSTVILDRQEGSDLIVMGSHGHTGLTAALLGSVAYRVLRRARTASLCLPMPHRSWLI